MLKYVVVVVICVLVSACSVRRDDQMACQNIGPLIPSTRTFTAAELDAVGMAAAKENPAVPQVPFAYGNKQWEQLKAIARPSDTFRTFDIPGVGHAPSSEFPDGILLMRGNCVVGLLGLVQP